MTKPADIDAYIASFPTDVQERLEQVRNVIKQNAPQAIGVISYGMPAFKFQGMLVWFGAHTNHIGLYPRVSAMIAFKERLLSYKTAKGSIQFPFDKPLPLDLIADIVKFRLAENLHKVKPVKK